MKRIPHIFLYILSGRYRKKYWSRIKFEHIKRVGESIL